MYFHQRLWRSERSRELKYSRTKTCMDVAFPYKEAITNTYSLINHTTTHVANQSLLHPRGKSQRSIIHT